jgi:hypothetical protein
MRAFTRSRSAHAPTLTSVLARAAACLTVTGPTRYNVHDA